MKRAESEEQARSRRTKRSSLADLSIKALSIEDGEIYFNDLGEKATPIRVHHLDFDVTNFNAASAFDVETKFAFPGDEQNVEASGKLGPLLNQGVLDASGIPVDLNVEARFDRARQSPAAGRCRIAYSAGAFDSRCRDR